MPCWEGVTCVKERLAENELTKGSVFFRKGSKQKPARASLPEEEASEAHRVHVVMDKPGLEWVFQLGCSCVEGHSNVLFWFLISPVFATSATALRC